MLIYNSLTQKKEKLGEPLNGKVFNLFVCGPTVYDHPHIGNARTYIAFDIIVGYLRSIGYKVYYLQNITDIDDKIIARAAEEKTSPAAIARKYRRAYHKAEKELGIDSVTKHAPASKYIKEIVKQVRTLLAKGYAYLIQGDGYYFDISKFADYGKLAHRTAIQAEDAVSRVDESVKKRNKGDFALWKLSHAKTPLDGEPAWRTSLGWGRPGWHIEDTAITEKHFGPQYDIHGGAIDLKFPHHEAEIAQQEAASGKKPLVKLWMHTGFLLVNGRKMSKSLGNFITINDFLNKYPASVLRYIIAGHHYRSPIDYNDNLAQSAQNAVVSLAQFSAKLAMADGKASLTENLKRYEKDFQEKMADDFNTPEALAVIFSAVNEINKKIWDSSKKEAGAAAQWVKKKLDLFKIDLPKPKIPLKIRRLAKKRELFRVNKQFVQSDALRKQLETLGYTVEDTPRGPLVWPR